MARPNSHSRENPRSTGELPVERERLSAAFGNDLPNDRIRLRVKSIVGQFIRPELRSADVAPLVNALVHWRASSEIIAILLNPEIPLETRSLVRDVLLSIFRHRSLAEFGLNWEDWYPLFEAHEDPELIAPLRRTISNMEVPALWRTLRDRLPDTSLAFPVRREIYRMLWDKAPAIEQPTPSESTVLTTLLAIPDASELATAANSEEVLSSYRGRVSPEDLDLMLVLLRSHVVESTPEYQYRCLLAKLVPDSAHLSAEDRKRVIEWEIEGLPKNSEVRDQRWKRTLNNVSRDVIRLIVHDENVPMAVRVEGLLYLPHYDILTFMRSTANTGVRYSDQCRQRVFAALHRRFPSLLGDAFDELCKEPERFSREILETPEFRSPNAKDLCRLSRDTRRSDFLRVLANEWALDIGDPSTRADQESYLRTYVQTEPSAALTLIVMALRTSCQYGQPDNAFYRKHILHGLANDKPSAFVLKLLPAVLTRHPRILFPLLRDLVSANEVTVEIRVQMLRYLESYGIADTESWAELATIFDDPTQPPEILDELVRVFRAQSSAVSGRPLLQLARHADLPKTTRGELLYALWYNASAIEHEAKPETSVFSVILDLINAPVSVWHLPGQRLSLPSYIGRISPEDARRAVELLRTQSSDLSAELQLGLLKAIPNEEVISTEERRHLAELWMSAMRKLHGDNLLEWRQFARFIACDPTLAREMIWDERVPLELRCGLTEKTLLTLEEAFAFMQKYEGMTVRHESLLTPLRGRVSDELWAALSRVLSKDAHAFSEFLKIPAFRDDDLTSLVTLALDPSRSKTLRGLAEEWIKSSLKASAPVTQAEVFATLVALWRLPDQTDDNIEVLSHLVPAATFQPGEAPRILARMRELLGDPSVSVQHRMLLFNSIDHRFLTEGIPHWWDAMLNSEDARFWAGVLYTLTRYNVLPTFVREKTKRHPTGDYPDFELSREFLTRLGAVFSKDFFELIRLAGDPQESPSLREVAIYQVRYRKIDGEIRQRLWSFVASPENRQLWTSHVLWTNVASKLSNGFQTSTDFREVVAAGHTHAFFLPIAALVQHPDQALVAQFARSFSLGRLSEVQRVLDAARSIPLGAQIAIGVLLTAELAHAPRAAGLINDAFSSLRSQHTGQSELIDNLLQIATAPPGIRARVASVLACCSASSDSPERGEQVIRLLRFAHLEAQLVARENSRNEGGIDQAPDLFGSRSDQLVSLSNDSSLEIVTQLLEASVQKRLLGILPNSNAAQLRKVLDQTVAPAVLAAHYNTVHREGLALLSEAVAVSTEGPEAWKNWKFHRPQARLQIAHLNDLQRQAWAEDLEIPVASAAVTEDVWLAASCIRTRFQQAVQNREVPPEYLILVQDTLAGRQSAVAQIRSYDRLRALMGRRLGNLPLDGAEDILREVPEAFRSEIRHALFEATASRETLFVAQRRVERAIDLLRLLYCDPSALAQNTLRATGEELLDQAGSASESAISYFPKLRYAFSHPRSRSRNEQEGVADLRLDPALANAQAALGTVKTFATSKSLRACECGDFRTLLEIGNRPYGQGSCQNHASVGTLNKALLAYVVDAMTKALVIRTAPTAHNSAGSPLARAIVRLGCVEESHAPILLVESVYASAGEARRYTPLIHRAACAFAERRGWRAAIPAENGGLPEAIVRIPASQNLIQYEDGHGARVDGSEAMISDEYALRVRFLQPTNT